MSSGPSLAMVEGMHAFIVLLVAWPWCVGRLVIMILTVTIYDLLINNY